MDGFLTFNQVCVSSNLTASTQKDMKSQVLTPKFTYFPTNGVVTHEGVTAADRGGVTGLLSRSTNGTLPGGTRFVEFTLTNHVVTGRNDGSADNLSFVLTAKVPPVIIASVKTTDGWQVEFTTSPGRLYSLERSEDLKAWFEVAPRTTGSGGTAVLVDTNTLAGEMFYRVGSRQPPP